MMDLGIRLNQTNCVCRMSSRRPRTSTRSSRSSLRVLMLPVSPSPTTIICYQTIARTVRWDSLVLCAFEDALFCARAAIHMLNSMIQVAAFLCVRVRTFVHLILSRGDVYFNQSYSTVFHVVVSPGQSSCLSFHMLTFSIMESCCGCSVRD
jgi:hypothetical protein